MYDNSYDEVHVSTTRGRAMRPLIVVKDKKPLLAEAHIKKLQNNEINWSNLVSEGVIEYLDATEEENALVALREEDLTEDHTHLEISPILLLGITSSLVPYGNYTNPVRLEMGTKVSKQSLGLYAANYLIRIDTDSSILHYPQIPILNSFVYDTVNGNKHPSGQNLVIAVMSYEGYNMEDAIIINKGSIDRGIGRSTYFIPTVAEELRYSGGLVDEIGLVDKEVKGYRTEEEYKHLEKDGVVYSEAQLKSDDAIIGKTSPPRFLGEVEEFSIVASTRREASSIVKHGEEGVVDMVILTENEEGNKLAQVRLRSQRIPEVGDKFASRHGQKGVISILVPAEDLPFTASGIVPDLIFSPHGIPSRMTISHLIEVIAGKAGALSGRSIDATTFDAMPEKEIRKVLESLGFRDNGTETVYSGIDGRELKTKIYVGNMYYLRLKHMVANKLHARATGKIQLLTRQPIEGRAQGGGLRVGEMEKDCFVAHGTSLLLKERFDSDRTIVRICENCGMFGVYDSFKNKEYCTKCGANVKISSIEVSYAFKLLLDELKSLCVYPKLILGRKY